MELNISKIMLGVLLVSSLPALAEEHWDRHFEGREIHKFGEHDLEIWRGGKWFHGRHEGQRGWWWIAAGIWYFYPTPVYPYPDPYTPPVTIVNPQAPVVVAPQAVVPVPPQPQSPPPAQNWYFCTSANGYYPYVPNCPEGWKSVPTQPPQGATR
jgi:hypothetical protein